MAGASAEPAVDVTAASPPADDSPLAALADVAPDARLLVSAAVIAAAAGTLIGARTSAGGGVAFTNVRLLPCLVKASLERHIDALNLILARSGGAAAPGVATAAGPGDPAGSAGAAVGGLPDRPRAHTTAVVVDLIPKLMDPVREGFDRVVRDAADEASDGLTDSRLMTQIGMLFGFVYLGFLTVWFWATRVRGSLRS